MLYGWQVGHPREVILSTTSPPLIILLAVLIAAPISVTDGGPAGAINCFVVRISSSLSALLPAPETIRVPLVAFAVAAKRA